MEVPFDIKQQRKALLDNLHYLKSLDVREYTFKKKYDELQYKIKTDRRAIHSALGGVWCPRDFENEDLIVANIQNLKPKIIVADDRDLTEWWDIYRLFVSSAEHNQTPGRYIKFFLVDTNQGETAPRGVSWRFYPSMLPWQVLGIGAISSDLTALGGRDKHIGWTKKQRSDGKLNHTAIGSTIVPTQPFGFNFLGGKLMAAMMTTETVRNEWQLQYGDSLVAMTTTSLYWSKVMQDGSRKKSSMYDGLHWWQVIGQSKGHVTIQPSLELYKRWLKFIKREKEEIFDELMEQEEGISGPVTNYKAKVMTLLFNAAGIDEKNFRHGFERGLYFSEFYENAKDFLCGRIAESQLRLKPLFQDDVNAIMEWWRPAAIGRYKMLKKQGRLKPQKHFYNEVGYMDYETAKENFFADVGR